MAPPRAEARFDPDSGAVFLAHDYRPLSAATKRDLFDPANGARVGCYAESDATTIAEAIALANAAQKSWAATDSKTRASLLHRLADSIEQGQRSEPGDPGGHRRTAELMVREMGKPYVEAVGELMNVAPIFRYFAELARDEGGQVAGTTAPGSFQHMRWFPYGVSVHILPYNFPIALMAFTLAASLAAGNGAIVKPAEATSLSTLDFMRHFRLLPAGLVACLTGGGAVAQQLIASPDTHIVAFTGSVETGRKVATACAERFKPCVIEAGGNDPMIVMESAPVEVAAAAAATAAFHLSGQVCTSTERFFVHDKLHDRFVAALAGHARALKIGPGMGRHEIGPLVSEAARAKVMALVDDALAKGAKLICGGRVPPGFNQGWFYEPTVLADCRPDMAIMQSETFGPVAPICRVHSFEEAIGLANASRYGLGASIFTADLEQAAEAVERLEAGMVWVNDILADNDALPFGGWKSSGLGRALGRHGLNSFRQAKMVMFAHKATLQGWWYPYSDAFFAEREKL